MLSWLNLRVVVVIASVLATLDVTMSTDPAVVARRAILVCGSMIVLYLLVFLIPLRKAVRAAGLFGLAVFIIVAWSSTALALIADSLPVPPEELLNHPWNWPRTAFVVAAAVSFYLFFDHATKGFAARDDMRQTGMPLE